MYLLFKVILLNMCLLSVVWARNDFFRPVREGQSSYDTQDKVKKIIPKIGLEDSLKRIDQILLKTYEEELTLELVLLEVSKHFKPYLDSCRSNKCKKNWIQDIFYLARHYEKIDDTFVLLVSHFLKNDKELIPFYKYLYALDFSEKNRIARNEDITTIKENLFLKENRFRLKVKKVGKLTPRQRLFILYSEQEMEIMIDILDQFLNRNFAESSKLVFLLEDGTNEEIPLSESEKYQAAVKLLNRDITRAVKDKKLSNVPLYSDLMAVGLEVGMISQDMLNEMIKLEALQDPYSSTWEKIGKISYRIGKAVLTINPVTSIYAMSAFLVIESVQQIRKENEKISDDHLF